jgi:hypothetical protein
MGTRHLTVIYDGELNSENELITIYGQYDGYPSGHGKTLKKLVGNKKIVNGLTNKGEDEVANGMGCFAAQLVALLKIKQREKAIEMTSYFSNSSSTHDGMAGGYYVYGVGTIDVGESYIYHLYFVEDLSKENQISEAWDLHVKDPENNPHPGDMIFEVGTLYLRLESGENVIYDGPFKDFDPEMEYSNEH